MMVSGRGRTTIRAPEKPQGPFGYDPDLYEGGRKGYGFARVDDDSDGDCDSSDNGDNKQEWNKLFQQQMKLRKGITPVFKEEDSAPLDPSCPLKDGGSKKIPKLTVKAREHCLRMLEEALKDNTPGGTDYSDSYLSHAVEMEYEAFRSSKMVNLYKCSVLKKVAEINKASRACVPYPVPTLGNSKSLDSKKELPDLDYEDGFQPVSQVYSFKRKRIGARAPKAQFQTASDVLRQSQVGSVQGVTVNAPLQGEQSPPRNPPITSVPNGSLPPIINGDDNSIESQNSSEEKARLPMKKKSSVELEKKDPLFKSPKETIAKKRRLQLAEAAKEDSQNISKFFKFGGVSETKTSVDSPQGNDEVDGKVSPKHSLSAPQSHTQGSNDSPNPEWDVKKESPYRNNETFTVVDKEQPSAGQKGFQRKELKNKERPNDVPGASLDAFTICALNEPAIEHGTETRVEMELSIPEEKLRNKKTEPEEDLEAPEMKRAQTDPSNIAPLEAKAGGSMPKKKVTFDPNLASEDKEGTTKTIQPVAKGVSLKDIAEIVVKYLTPFFKDGRFASKELFKAFARQLSHFLTNEKNPQRKNGVRRRDFTICVPEECLYTTLRALQSTVKEEAHRLIKQFFKTREKCESEVDWQGLLDSGQL